MAATRSRSQSAGPALPQVAIRVQQVPGRLLLHHKANAPKPQNVAETLTFTFGRNGRHVDSQTATLVPRFESIPRHLSVIPR